MDHSVAKYSPSVSQGENDRVRLYLGFNSLKIFILRRSKSFRIAGLAQVREAPSKIDWKTTVLTIRALINNTDILRMNFNSRLKICSPANAYAAIIIWVIKDSLCHVHKS